jgi:hypothetical protein
MATIKAVIVVLVVVLLGGCAVKPGGLHSPYGDEFLADD